MRAAAEVGEVTLRIEGDRLLGILDELDLVRLSHREETLPRFLSSDLLSRPAATFVQLFSYFRLDALEVLLDDRLGEIEVVVEAVLDRRADRDLDAGIEPLDRLREEVGA